MRQRRRMVKYSSPGLIRPGMLPWACIENRRFLPARAFIAPALIAPSVSYWITSILMVLVFRNRAVVLAAVARWLLMCSTVPSIDLRPPTVSFGLVFWLMYLFSTAVLVALLQRNRFGWLLPLKPIAVGSICAMLRAWTNSQKASIRAFTEGPAAMSTTLWRMFA